jgi:hypothetical protein
VADPYTNPDIDGLLSAKQRQIDLKAAKSEILALSKLQETRIQSNENSVSTIQTDINSLKASNASLNSRILTHNVSNIFSSSTNIETGQFYLLRPGTDVTIGEVKIIYSGDGLTANFLNDTTEILTTSLAGASGAWQLKGPDTGAALSNTSSLILDVKAATNVTKLTVQVDFAVG